MYEFQLGALSNLIGFEMKQSGGKTKAKLSSWIDQLQVSTSLIFDF